MYHCELHYFKQWTGDNLKALMKLYLPAINDHVLCDIAWALRALLEFCYLVCRNTITETTLAAINNALEHYHQYHRVFYLDIASTFSIPHQHVMTHYPDLIHLFGPLNGLCSSIIEWKHIKALARGHFDFNQWKMLDRTCVSHILQVLVADWSVELEIPQLCDLIQQFVFQMANPQDPHDLINIPLCECLIYDGKVKVFHTTSATFYVPSDFRGIGRMWCEMTQSNPSWRHSSPQLDWIDVVHILTFFSFKTEEGDCYPCAIVRWFVLLDEPDEDIGMWIVHPGYNTHRQLDISVIHIDAIYCVAHLIPVYRTQEIPPEIGPHHSYDVFHSYYVHRYADHHAFEITS
ncbi:hypothetical protein V8E55_012177 [Tylopilus felleus]